MPLMPKISQYCTLSAISLFILDSYLPVPIYCWSAQKRGTGSGYFCWYAAYVFELQQCGSSEEA